MKIFILLLFITAMFASSCSNLKNFLDMEATEEELLGYEILDIADVYTGMNERQNRRVLREFMGVDPVRTE